VGRLDEEGEGNVEIREGARVFNEKEGGGGNTLAAEDLFGDEFIVGEGHAEHAGSGIGQAQHIEDGGHLGFA
jgi:hypothetical protein